jgi:hypothetical protein
LRSVDVRHEHDVRCATCDKPSRHCPFACADKRAAPPPKAPDVPAVDGPAWLRVGARVRIARNDVSCFHENAVGRLATITEVNCYETEAGQTHELDVDGFRKQWGNLPDFEPIPEPADEREGWRPEACGWRRDNGWKRGTAHVEPTDPCVSAYSQGLMWFDQTTLEWHASLEQAMCAALSIELEENGGLWLAFYQGNAYDLGEVRDAESCARAALDAHAKAGGR